MILIFEYSIILYIEGLAIAVISLVSLLISVAYFTLAERKLIASVQRRTGPSIVGFWGLLQPLADGLKLVIKEILWPYVKDTYDSIHTSIKE